MDAAVALATWIDAFRDARGAEPVVSDALDDLASRLRAINAEELEIEMTRFLYAQASGKAEEMLSAAMARHVAVAVADGLATRLGDGALIVPEIPHVPLQPEGITVDTLETWRNEAREVLVEDVDVEPMQMVEKIDSMKPGPLEEAFARCYRQYVQSWQQGWAFADVAQGGPQ